MERRARTYFSFRATLHTFRLRWRHRRYFRLLVETVTLGKDLLLGAQIQSGERQKIVSAALLAYLLDTIQAGGLLVRAGLERQAAMMIRSSVETFVLLIGCCSDENFVTEYLASDKVRQLKLVRGALNLTDLTEDQRASFEQRKMELASEVSEAGATELKVEQVARRFQLANEYNLVYRLTSPHVHAAPRALEELAVSTLERRLTGLDIGPSDRYAEVYLFTLAEYALGGASQLAQLLSVEKPPEVDWCNRELQRLQPNWPEDVETSPSS